MIEIASLTGNEIEEIKKIDEKRRFGFGEIEAIAICLHRENCILLSNDDVVNKIEGLKVFNLEDLISLAIDENVIKTLKELDALVDLIQNKDKIKIRNYAALAGKFKK